MSRYLYRAKNNNNEIVVDYINAINISDAAAKLERKNLIVLEIKEDAITYSEREFRYEKTISPDTMFTMKEKLEFFNSFYHMFKSGLSIMLIFEAIKQESRNKKIKGLCSIILRNIDKGLSLKEAFKGHEQILGVAYSSLLVAGESSGKLDKTISKIIANIKREEEFKLNIISALSYPVMILMLAIAVFFFFKFFVLKVFATMGAGCSSCAVMTMLVTAIVKIVIIFALIFGAIFYVYMDKKLLRAIVDVASSFPLVKPLMKNYMFANFFSVLALAYDAGIPLPNSIELANTVMGIPSVKGKISLAIKRIMNGCELTTAFGVTQVFSEFAMSQISAGEKAGELEKMFEVVSFDYEKQIDLALKVLTEFVKIFAMAFVGLIVFFVATNAYNSYYSNLFNALGM
ncbi:type II secretion system F family protein [bacterium]|nr:type II secretion system F family protein [bacterium]